MAAAAHWDGAQKEAVFAAVARSSKRHAGLWPFARTCKKRALRSWLSITGVRDSVNYYSAASKPFSSICGLWGSRSHATTLT
eukprot:3518743-Pleurochrysis_carterae.AAC.8